MEQIIYLIEGETGEYSDYVSWNVAAYAEEEKAREHVDQANKWLEDHGVLQSDHSDHDAITKAISKLGEGDLNPFDDEMKVDYTGTSYRLMPIKFFS